MEWQRQVSDEQLRLSRALHDEEQALAAAHFAQQHEQALRLHAVEREMVTSVSRLEAMRDEWSLRQQLSDSVMVVAGVLITAVFEGLSQSFIPRNTPTWLAVLHAIAGGGCIAMLTVSLALGLRSQQRMGTFDMTARKHYACGRPHESFESFYDCHCRRLSSASMMACFAGAALALVMAVTLLGSKIIVRNGDVEGAVVFLVFTSLSALVFPLAFIWRRRTWLLV